METEETVEMIEGDLVKTTEVALGGTDGVTTVVDNGTSNKGERTVGRRDRDDTDTIAVGIREGDKEEDIIDGDSLEGSSQSCSVSLAPEKCMRRQWAIR